MEYKKVKTEILLLENGKIQNLMDMAFIFGIMEINMRENFLMV